MPTSTTRLDAGDRSSRHLLRLPAQSAPVHRIGPGTAGGRNSDSGLEASRTVCDGLRGTQQQLCYAINYGVST